MYPTDIALFLRQVASARFQTSCACAKKVEFQSCFSNVVKLKLQGSRQPNDVRSFGLPARRLSPQLLFLDYAIPNVEKIHKWKVPKQFVIGHNLRTRRVCVYKWKANRRFVVPHTWAKYRGFKWDAWNLGNMRFLGGVSIEKLISSGVCEGIKTNITYCQ